MDPNDRFGMPDSAIKAAIDGHKGNIIRTGLYVPTRQEVATLPPKELRLILIDWIWESPSEIIPSNAQIEDVISVLKARPDVEKVQGIIDECYEYLKS